MRHHLGSSHPISASSFDHLEPFWTSHLYSAATPGDVKEIRWLPQTSFPDIHLKCSLPEKWPCVLCCLENPQNFIKLPEGNTISCCKRPSPKGIQGSQYIVRKTPQGIEMITPEMLPKNMTTLMNQAASSWKTLEADEAHRKQTQKGDGARGLSIIIGAGWVAVKFLLNFYQVSLVQLPLLPTRSTFALKDWVLQNRCLPVWFPFPNTSWQQFKYTYHITHRHLTPFSKGNHALLNLYGCLRDSCRLRSQQGIWILQPWIEQQSIPTRPWGNLWNVIHRFINHRTIP